MAIVITDTILKRLVNFNNVVQLECQMANKRQWQRMTLDNMQAAQQSREKASTCAAIAGYCLYLYKVQHGLRENCRVYGEPLLHNALLEKMKELRIPVSQTEIQL